MLKQVSPASHDLLESATPLIVVGAWSRATNVLVEGLARHPAVVFTRKCSLFRMLSDDIQASHEGFSAGLLYGKEHHELWSAHLRKNARALIENFYAAVARKEEKAGPIRFWGDADVHYFECLDFIADVCPDARFIHIAEHALGADPEPDNMRQALERLAGDGRVLELCPNEVGNKLAERQAWMARVLVWLDLAHDFVDRSTEA